MVQSEEITRGPRRPIARRREGSPQFSHNENPYGGHVGKEHGFSAMTKRTNPRAPNGKTGTASDGRDVGIGVIGCRKREAISKGERETRGESPEITAR